ncbi:hypothetical protein ACH5AL_15270 [Actinacidiphila glaucinigra]|uniref:hypothetical protein n=1 Tax=Actinacidiphila glaucinigra TaxID=235986 RepID=UPI0037B4B47B
MPGEEIDYGSARITIDLDDSEAVSDARDLGLRIRRALDRATRTVGTDIRNNIERGMRAASVAVTVEPDLPRFDTALLAGLRGLGSISIPVEPDLTGFTERLRAHLAGEELRVQVEPDLGRFDSALLSGLSSLTSINVPVTPDMTGFVERIRAVLAGEEFRVRVVPDMDGFDDRIRAHNPPDVEVNVEPDVDSNRFTRALSGLGRIAGRVGSGLTSLLQFGAVGIAAAGATQGVIGLTAALAPAAGIIAALPAAVAGFQAALGTLRLAVVGVGDALGAAFAGDAAKFQEALEKLSPSAQKAVLAVKEFAPELKKVQQSVQEAFFSQFAGEISGAVKNLLPMQSGLRAIATGFGQAAQEGLKFLQTRQALASVQGVLSGTSDAVEGLSAAVGPLAQGLLSVASSVSQAFGARLGTALGGLGQQLGDFLNRIADNGQAVAWVEGALTVFKQLGSIISNVGQILSGVFQAANASGGGLLNNLKQITTSFAEFVNSAQGQEAIGNIFSTLATVAAQLGPILSAVVTQVGAIAPALAPIFTALGPAIVNLVNALAAIAPALATVGQALAQGLGALGPSLAPLGEAIGRAVEALAPLLPLVGEVAGAVAQILAPALDILTSVLSPIIDALLPILPQIATAFTTLGAALGPVADVLGKILGDALTRLLPPILELIPQIQGKMVPAWIALADAVTPLIPELVNLVVLAIEPLLPMLPQLVDMIADLSANFVLALAAVVPILPPLVRLFTTVSQFVASKTTFPVLQGLVDALTGLVGIVTTVQTKAREFFTGTIQFFAELGPGILAALASLPEMIGSFFSGLWTTVSTAVVTGFNAVMTFFAQLPGLILSALAALPGLLISFFVNAIAGLGIAILTGIAAVIFVFTELPGMIVSALASLGSTLLTFFTSVFTTVVAAVTSFVSQVVAFFAALPGQIASFLAALPGRVVSFFRSAGSSALATARTYGTQVINFFRELPGRIASGLSSLGSKLVDKLQSAGSAALRGAQQLISTIANAFTKLPGLILGKIGDIGGQIRAKIAGGLPASVRGLIPGLANGGIVTGPTFAMLGEGSRPEVVIPLTKPKRARELAAKSGLLNLLAGPAQAATLAASSVPTVRGGGSVKDFENVGRQIAAGLVAGLRASLGDVDRATSDLVGIAVTTAEQVLEIASPSKVFARIGKDTGRGFIVGLTGTADQIKATTDKLIKSITEAFKGKATKVDDRLVTLLQSGNKKLTSLAAQRDALVKKIADAQKFAADTTASVLQAFSLQSLTQGGGKITADSIVAGLDGALSKVRSFTSQIDALARRGLRKDLLQQIIGLGPEQGAELARVLSTADKATFKRINSMQAQLVDASNVLGRTGADVLFDAGKNAGAGFLAGLQGQRKAIEKLMLDIAKSMQKAIRTALRIKSPSVVFRKIGEMTGLGLRLGLVGQIAALQKASTSAARAVVDAVGGQFDALPGRVGSSLDGLGTGNVIPLTRAQKRRQAATEISAAELARARATVDKAATVFNNTFNITEVGDAGATAHRVLNRLTYAAGVS